MALHINILYVFFTNIQPDVFDVFGHFWVFSRVLNFIFILLTVLTRFRCTAQACTDWPTGGTLLCGQSTDRSVWGDFSFFYCALFLKAVTFFCFKIIYFNFGGFRHPLFAVAGWYNTVGNASCQFHKVLWWSLCPSHIFLFWHCVANEMFLSNTILLTVSSLIWFLKCFSYQHGVTCQQCQKPFMIHLFSVKYGGALLRWAYESRPPSYFLISCMPPTLPFHHMVISCSQLKWGMWMLICQPLCSKWRTQSNLLSSCCCP